MSTRGAYGVYLEGKTKIFYNHSDSYPRGLGQDMIDQTIYLVNKYTIEQLKEMARNLRSMHMDEQPTAEEIKKIDAALNKLGWEPCETEDMYVKLRNVQGNLVCLLEDIQVGVNSNKFLSDSLFCEWAYIINLDDGLFEVYRGFQRAPHLLGRYHWDVIPSDRGNQYYPVALS